MAVDIGFRNTGLVFWEYDGKWNPIYSEVIKTESESKKRNVYAANDTVRCIQESVRRLLVLTEEYSPGLLLCELPHQGGKSANAIKAMAMATAMVACTTEFIRLPAEWFTPTQIKLALTGKKVATKDECMIAAGKKYPEFVSEYVSKRSASGYKGGFDHVADAIGVFEAAVGGSQMVRMLEN
jgi:Holliday junction resolvasome RuvABC endonuclease subunit